MSFELVATSHFVGQMKSLDERQKKLVRSKLELVERNPFRYKRLHSNKFSRAFRVRLNIGGKETRLIYYVLGSKIIVAGLLERAKEYKDLEKTLSGI
jgi:mRNA-degrading endonuclease RelE of RelBE toxin-antitoxin system